MERADQKRILTRPPTPAPADLGVALFAQPSGEPFEKFADRDRDGFPDPKPPMVLVTSSIPRHSTTRPPSPWFCFSPLFELEARSVNCVITEGHAQLQTALPPLQSAPVVDELVRGEVVPEHRSACRVERSVIYNRDRSRCAID